MKKFLFLIALCGTSLMAFSQVIKQIPPSNNGTRVHTNITDVSDRTDNDTPLTVYPNPSNGLVHIQLATELRTEARLEVWNSIGQILIRNEVTLLPGENETSVDLTSLPAGTYFKGSGVGT